MGVKYVQSDSAPAGYELFREDGNVKIFRNRDVLPLGYVTDRLISTQDLRSTVFPYRQELLMNNAVVGSDWKGKNVFHTKIEPLSLRLPLQSSKNISITSDSQGIYHINARNIAFRLIALPEPAETDQVVFLQMNVKNLTKQQDISITIQNVRNRLSAASHNYYNGNTVFHFAVTVNQGSRFLTAEFSPGEYEISSLASYMLNAADLKGENETDSPFEVLPENSGGDAITGNVNARKDGYFITSIPYDENFRITLDGKETAFEKVNAAFIGFPVPKGDHNITLCYEAPGFRVGAAASACGFCLLGLSVLFRKKSG